MVLNSVIVRVYAINVRHRIVSRNWNICMKNVDIGDKSNIDVWKKYSTLSGWNFARLKIRFFIHWTKKIKNKCEKRKAFRCVLCVLSAFRRALSATSIRKTRIWKLNRNEYQFSMFILLKWSNYIAAIGITFGVISSTLAVNSTNLLNKWLTIDSIDIYVYYIIFLLNYSHQTVRIFILFDSWQTNRNPMLNV